MRDEACVRFLQWALPRLGLRWTGFRKVRGQVCKRVARRMHELGLADAGQYRTWLESHPDEWPRLDSMCRVTISRFYRDRGVFAALARRILPELVGGQPAGRERGLRAWSAGCGSGEEPYTLAILWALELEAVFPDVRPAIVATDADAGLLCRARNARYDFASLKELPADWRDRAFVKEGDSYRLCPEFMRGVDFLQQDIRRERPAGYFDLILCRNLVFTYFDEATQTEVLERIASALRKGGALVLGIHETLQEGAAGMSAWSEKHRVYRKL